jgi:hypothetical protein
MLPRGQTLGEPQWVGIRCSLTSAIIKLVSHTFLLQVKISLANRHPCIRARNLVAQEVEAASEVAHIRSRPRITQILHLRELL